MITRSLALPAAFAVTLTLLLTNCLAQQAEQAKSSKQQIGNTTAPAEQEPAPLFQMHYENRVKVFFEQNLLLQHVVLLGDSITEGFDTSKYLPGRRVLNRGIGADVIGNNLVVSDKRGLLKRLDESVFNCSPTHLFILIGINDLGQGHTPDVVEEGYRELLARIRERLPRLKVYVQSVLPCSGKFAIHNKNILDVNKRLQQLAAEFHCQYIDLHSRFVDEQGELKSELTTEGLHLTPAAYEIWADIVEVNVGWKK